MWSVSSHTCLMLSIYSPPLKFLNKTILYSVVRTPMESEFGNKNPVKGLLRMAGGIHYSYKQVVHVYSLLDKNKKPCVQFKNTPPLADHMGNRWLQRIRKRTWGGKTSVSATLIAYKSKTINNFCFVAARFPIAFRTRHALKSKKEEKSLQWIQVTLKKKRG